MSSPELQPGQFLPLPGGPPLDLTAFENASLGSVRGEPSVGVSSIGFPLVASVENILPSFQLGIAPITGLPDEVRHQHVFDCIALVLYCPKCDKFAIQLGDKGRWWPYLAPRQRESWRTRANIDAMHILAHLDLQNWLRETGLTEDPFHASRTSMIHLLRIQMPDMEFFTRATFLIQLKEEKERTQPFECCRDDEYVRWYKADQVIRGQIEKLWGVEVQQFAAMIPRAVNGDRMTGKFPRDIIVEEYSAEEEALKFFSSDASKYKETSMIKAAEFEMRHVSALYKEYVEQCFPSSTMSLTTFMDLMCKIGWKSTDNRLQSLYRAFAYKRTGHLSFLEFLTGLIAMERATVHGGSSAQIRLNLIFRYYDQNSDGILSFRDMRRMLVDIEKAIGSEGAMDWDETERKTKRLMESLAKGSKHETITYSQFIDGVASKRIQGTSELLRTSYPLKDYLERKHIVNEPVAEEAETMPQVKGVIAAIQDYNYPGVCISCRSKKYHYTTCEIKLNMDGRVIETRKLPEQYLNPSGVDDGILKHVRRASVEVLHNPYSIVNIVLQELRSNSQINFKSLSSMIPQICNQVISIFEMEPRVLDLSSPCLVIGPMHGNWRDLQRLEKIFWKSAPIVNPIAYLFLGDLIGTGGRSSMQVLLYLYCLKILAPDKFNFVRGSFEHATHDTALKFKKFCRSEFGEEKGMEIYGLISATFDRMPLAAVIDDRIYCSNFGYLQSSSSTRIIQLNKIPSAIEQVRKFVNFVTASSRNISQCRWFMDTNEFSHIIQATNDRLSGGYRIDGNGKIISISTTTRHETNGSQTGSVVYIDSQKIRLIMIDR